MKLDDFVAETLKQIIKGVVAAQEYGSTQNAKVNPSTAVGNHNNIERIVCQETGIPLQKVGFDIAVTVSEEQSKSDDGHSVGSISVSSTSLDSVQNSSVSRIQFDVHVLLPTSKI
jgi:hypothetical protein